MPSLALWSFIETSCVEGVGFPHSNYSISMEFKHLTYFALDICIEILHLYFLKRGLVIEQWMQGT